MGGVLRARLCLRAAYGVVTRLPMRDSAAVFGSLLILFILYFFMVLLLFEKIEKKSFLGKFLDPKSMGAGGLCPECPDGQGSQARYVFPMIRTGEPQKNAGSAPSIALSIASPA